MTVFEFTGWNNVLQGYFQKMLEVFRRAVPGFVVVAVAVPGMALAHASEQSFVLLLPTGLYTAGGVAAVALTALILVFLPDRATLALFRPLRLAPPPALRRTRRLGWRLRWRLVAGWLGCLAFLGLVWLGLRGPHDPTVNLLPIALWTVLWGILVPLQALTGNLWARFNPWAGPLLSARALGLRPLARLPARLGHWPALASLTAFGALLLIDPRAQDPHRLVVLASGYWALHLAGGLVFGPGWIGRAEVFAALSAAYARLVPLHAGRLGLPGWRIAAAPAPGASLAVLMAAMLALGSFDGLNETYFWFDLIGVNPLEFAGRTSVVGPNAAGLLAALPAMAAVFAACLWLGQRLGGGPGLGITFRTFAPALLPIALGYHIAHYLPGLLVELQYLPLALTDPLGRGADYLGIGEVHVTTGFFNRLDTVRVIWLAQAGAVVGGHVLAILLGHRLAIGLYGSTRRAVLAQAPLAAFMVGYTLFGLWLLASPRL